MSVHVRVLAAIGLALLAAGLALGLIPVSAGCGAPFHPTDSIDAPADCAVRVTTQRTPALALLLTGGALTAAALGLHVTDPAPARRGLHAE